MRYLKTFENMESPYDKYIDYLTSFMDDKFIININDRYIRIDINYTKREVYNNRGRDILGIYDTNDVSISNRKPGQLIYSMSRKTEETLELVDMITDTVLKIANLTDNKEGFFILNSNSIVIYLYKYDYYL